MDNIYIKWVCALVRASIASFFLKLERTVHGFMRQQGESTPRKISCDQDLKHLSFLFTDVNCFKV